MIKRTAIVLLTALLLISTTGCGSLFNTVTVHEYNEDKVASSVMEGNNQFAWDIFKELNQEDSGESIFISPLSISTALSMTYQGAEGTTKDGMAEGLRYQGIDMEVLNESYRELLKYMNNMDQGIELNIANSIWAREGGGFKEAFLDINQDVFDAYVTELDFSKADSADKINGWIEDATEGKIEEMIQGPISSNVLMYLINAIYFKGSWTVPFEEAQTFDGEFFTEDGDVNDIKMMRRNGKVAYGDGVDFTAVKLPYGNESTSMYVILPEENTSINDFIGSMDHKKWNEIREGISSQKDVELQIPKFELEYGIKELNNSLANLGMGEAFGPAADFSKIREGIFISEVLHKAVIEVNEEGSEAAAATVVVMTESAMADPLSFVANRPFMFVIANDESDTILFMGKLSGIN
ncbi:proteinase inhibitor I4, serpin [Alkaliphilus metalliredigens QYMF]|uniref:Proteinase inhibitor I4, serpin n=1 Tax=Alkaliphilus metalliredigens (strain QYMF) TaxID=293826 RepID=A6TQ56_ALKMQ|nr:serpin family protein [Alkaliphilus metalliredigens]ABR48324.1 proteinase inhibitor I4, serpin [Alkaliphilus metalliredigens QYMF]